MKHIHYILSPLFYVSVAFAGRYFTARGLSSWYPSILKPSYTPPGSFIGVMWTLIYILTALSLIIFINRAQGQPLMIPAIVLYVLNGILNAAWSYIFFTKHLIGVAVIDAALLAITVLLIMVLAWRLSPTAAILLVPYFIWVSFATFLTYEIYKIN
jgi:benzodiazapine receptor